jgi:hypothetical protein
VHALEVAGRGRRDLHARAHAARDRHEPRDLVLDERAPTVAVAADDVQHARRQELGRELGEHHRGLGRLSAGFSTTVFPAASAGAIFQIAIISG